MCKSDEVMPNTNKPCTDQKKKKLGDIPAPGWKNGSRIK